MSRSIPIIAAAMIVSGAAQAATDEGKFAIKGAGAGTCEEYTAERAKQSQTYALYGGWLTGYLTAYNLFQEETFDIAPWQSTDLLAALLANYCQRNPGDQFIVAVNALVHSLSSTRLRTMSQIVEVRSDTSAVQIYQMILRRTQEVLAELGYYAGTKDGVYGADLRAALVAYQKEKNIPVTGLPDQQTLYELLR